MAPHDRQSEVTLRASPRLATSLRRGLHDAQLERVAASIGATVEPMHPMIPEGRLALYFRLSVPADVDVDALLEQIRNDPDIDEAYMPPPIGLPDLTPNG